MSEVPLYIGLSPQSLPHAPAKEGGIQKYLAHQKQPAPEGLHGAQRIACSYMVLSCAVSYERSTPVSYLQKLLVEQVHDELEVEGDTYSDLIPQPRSLPFLKPAPVDRGRERTIEQRLLY